MSLKGLGGVAVGALVAGFGVATIGRLIFGSNFSIGGKTTDSYIGVPLGNSPTVACTFERTIEVAYEENQIVHNTPRKEERPLVFIFSDLHTTKPKVEAVGAANSVYEADLTVLSNTPEKIVLGELTPTEGNVFIYSIHRDKGVGTWTKQYQSLGIPLGTIGMGKCSSS